MSSPAGHDRSPGEAVENRPPVGVLVLGMHRSGTSAATRLVNLLGPSLCIRSDLMTGNTSNVKGFWESRSLMRTNNLLLSEMGRKWWFPPSPEVLRQWEDDVADATVDAARSAFVRAHPTEPWVWKDPRTCLTLSFWRHALVRPVAGIVVHRNPLDIARSLEQRNHMDPEYSSALWMRYMRLLLEQAGGMPLLVTGYDGLLEDPVGWSDAVRTFLGDLGMPVAAQLDHASISAFVDPTLRHSTEHAPDAGPTAALYDVLRSLDGVHPSFVVPALGAEAPWIEERLAEVGPEWHPTWRNPAAEPPTAGARMRSLWRRMPFVKN